MRIVKLFLMTFLFLCLIHASVFASDKSDWEGGFPDGCTSITVGKQASADGSVMTSHTCDSHRTRSWLDIVPAQKHKPGSEYELVKRVDVDSLAMPTYGHVKTGTIKQVAYTHGFVNTAYPCINDKQLAIGESTFGGREILKSDSGLIDCQALVRLMLERCTTARDAIALADSLTKQYGWIDEGECLTIADTKEVWHFEIVGPGEGSLGAIWAAQRVPDDQVSVNANASRIRQVEIENSDYFMASDNLTTLAQDSGWWKPEAGPFEFCYAYNPTGRQTFSARRREWRVLDLVAPSLGLNANSENFPFSVKPDSLITLQKMVNLFQDYFEDTDFDMTKNITVTDDSGRTVKSPLANPFMPYDMNKMLKINGGWGWRGERPIARWYTMYATITQSRDWLPDEIGGVVWLALDNVASSVYVPLYCSITKVPVSYQTPGRPNGYTTQSAWWAFNRMGTLAAQRWGDMRIDVRAVWDPMQTRMFNDQNTFEASVLTLHQKSPRKAIQKLTDYSNQWGETVVNRCWQLGDFLWTKYDEKF